jgi:inorganic pyrophosphatase
MTNIRSKKTQSINQLKKTTTKRTITTKTSKSANTYTTSKKFLSTMTQDMQTYLAKPNGVFQEADYFLSLHKPNSNIDDHTSIISPWHHIPLVASSSGNHQPSFNFVCEIAKGTTAKFEIDTKTPNNPIKQDIKKGQLRHFKYGNLPFNYGALPQTWEDPKHIDPIMKLGGDNDPLDVVEISDNALQHGGVYPVKILGALALIDEGEVDWKLIAINTAHPLADSIHTTTDLNTHLPEFENSLVDWFKNYKTAEGKGQNEFGFEGKLLDKLKAHEIIQQCHDSWLNLSKGVKSGVIETSLAVAPLEEGFQRAELKF